MKIYLIVQVSELRGEVKVTCVDVQSVHHAVRTLVTHLAFPMSMRLLLDVN